MANSRVGHLKRELVLPLANCSHLKSAASAAPRAAYTCSRFFWVLMIWLVAAAVLIAAIPFVCFLHFFANDSSPHPKPSPYSLLAIQMPPSASVPSASQAQFQIILPQNKSSLLDYKSTSGNYTTYGRSACVASPDSQNGSTAKVHKYYLAALIANRIFEKDLFHMSSYDIKQWIEYMLYAGVEHIYWYDTAHEDIESQESHLAKYVELGLVTYHRFHHLFPDSIQKGYHFEQDNTHRHFLEHYALESKWVAELDVDEYPFSLKNTSSCFLKRLMQEYDKQSALVSQVLMQCMFFLGNPMSNKSNAWLLEKYQRRKTETEGGSRPKPIFRPDFAINWLGYFDPHIIPMKEGITSVADPEKLRMNHYWGARATNFGADTPELLEILVDDQSVQPIVDKIKAITRLNSRNATLIGTMPTMHDLGILRLPI